MVDIDRLALDFATRHPDSFARILGHEAPDIAGNIVENLPAERKASIVARLPAAHLRQLLDSGQHRPADWLVDAPFDDALNLLSRIPREKRLVLINSLSDRHRQRELLRLQQYPSHSVGAVISDIPLCLSAESSAGDALDRIREFDTESQGRVVIVDTDGHYLGILNRWQLLLRNPPIGQVKDYLATVSPLRPETPVHVAATNDAWHTHNWLPVVDHRNRVLGIASREKTLRAAEAHAEGRPAGDSILFDLLADLVRVGDLVLTRTLSTSRGP